jgi:hypothetical protein
VAEQRCIRFSAGEWRWLRRQAKLAGKTMAAFLRDRALRGMAKTLR